jgi:hypothetical protein
VIETGFEIIEESLPSSSAELAETVGVETKIAKDSPITPKVLIKKCYLFPSWPKAQALSTYCESPEP